jgi:hypothetical protein
VSVVVATRRANEADLILALLMRKAVVTVADMKEISDSYRQRLGDLRKTYDIRCDRKASGNTWSLVRKIPGEQLSLLATCAA